jgi:hypothetical protein
MSTILKLVAALALIAVAFVAVPDSAQAQHHHHGGYHHRGGFGFGFGFGNPYAYYPPPAYYYGPDCRWQRVRYWRHGYWHWRSVRRCY